MKYAAIFTFIASVVAGAITFANSNAISTIEEYNSKLPKWGFSWLKGEGATGYYYRSFYTGFAMRSEFPDRIHIRLGRGNQTRVSVVLDQQTITDYLFDLETRYHFYSQMTSGDGAKVNLRPKRASLPPHASYFSQIIESPVYEILPTVQKAKAGQLSDTEIYSKSLQVLSQLNPGRVFPIRLDLTAEFNKWKSDMTGVSASEITGSAAKTIEAIDSLVWGRINYSHQPSTEVLKLLGDAVTKANGNNDDAFQAAALELFKAVTGSKYDLKVVDANGQWADAIQCANGACTLTYPEFTAIYPTGVFDGSDKDKFGNSIPKFATQGMWNFVVRNDGVDHVRSESFYAWIPKMDYQSIGNGFHNPAVRNSVRDSDRETLNIPEDHQQLWAVSRNRISHGCSRLPSGHVWEMRHIMPVDSDKMKEVLYFGSEPTDFDLYDIDGDGQNEIMGVDYAIYYGTVKGDRREGTGLKVMATEEAKLKYYSDEIFGAKGVFEVQNGKLIFIDPDVSLPSYLDSNKDTVKVRVAVEGKYPLYEQAYEQDKIQMFAGGNDDTTQIFGRVRGCAPTSDPVSCGSAAFKASAKSFGIKLKD